MRHKCPQDTSKCYGNTSLLLRKLFNGETWVKKRISEFNQFCVNTFSCLLIDCTPGEILVKGVRTQWLSDWYVLAAAFYRKTFSKSSVVAKMNEDRDVVLKCCVFSFSHSFMNLWPCVCIIQKSFAGSMLIPLFVCFKFYRLPRDH